MKTAGCLPKVNIRLSIWFTIIIPWIFLPFSAHAQPNWRYTFLTNSVALYVGKLEEETVESFIRIANTKEIKTLIITSPGGSISAGVSLGNWVYKNQVNIEVDRVCMSSCANYVFSAGKLKKINNGALIVWHGGAEQKNFREMLDYFRVLSGRLQKREVLSEEEMLFLVENEARYPIWEKQTALQKGLFDLLGIDEYITRIGQEPINFLESWTIPIHIMEKFGLNNIKAAEDYGSLGYIERAFASSGLAAKPILLSIDSLGQIAKVQE